MLNRKFLVSLVMTLAVVFLLSNVSAAVAEITGVSINDGDTTSVTAGETIKVRVGYQAYENATDLRMKIWLTGARDNQVVSERFDVYENDRDSETVAIQIPSDIESSTETLTLHVTLESRNGGSIDSADIPLRAKREPYIVEVLDAEMDSKVQAGSTLGMNIVLKNRGSHFSEDTFVKVSIPSLGVEKNAYFGDLSPVDQSNPDKEDAVERRMLLSIPSDAKPGIYTVELEAYSADSSTTLSKKVLIVGASEDSMVLASSSSKTFAVGDQAVYTMTLVNSGNKIKVYELTTETASENLDVSTSETLVAVPAGTSKTVEVYATASKAGKYAFTVNVISSGDLVNKESFTANVEGSSTSKALSGNTAVVLTVVLAIIFVVLLVVLIVLLTRKPEKQEIGESYY